MPRPWEPTTSMSTPSASAAATIWSPGSPVQTRNDTSTPRSRPRATSACASRSSRSRTWSTRARNRPPGSAQRARVDHRRPRAATPRGSPRGRAPGRSPTRSPRRGPSPAGAGARARPAGRWRRSGRARAAIAIRTPVSAATIVSTSAVSGTTMSTLTMPNIPSGPSTWGRMWQWNAHSPTRSAVDVDVPALARADRDRVRAVRVGPERVAVPRHDLLPVPVAVERVVHDPLVHEPDPDPSRRRPRGSAATAGNPWPLIVNPPRTSFEIQT